MTQIIAIIAILLLAGFGMYKVLSRKRKTWVIPKGEFPKRWRRLLMENVAFYNSLDDAEKELFEDKVLEFIANIKITGVKTDVTDLDKLLVASSGIIPIFAFPKWKYFNLNEVLIYPNSFNEDFETKGQDRRILGMVGTGYMDQKMILSINALRTGFANESDRKNTAIHEFIHLIDKADGLIDGIPKVLTEKQYAIPWFDLIDQKIEAIRKIKSEIRPYGGTSRIEFFAVLGEYFFEMPTLLQQKHPVLYNMLEEIFDQDMAERELEMKKIKVGRNDLCYCGSMEKHKNCCGVEDA